MNHWTITVILLICCVSDVLSGGSWIKLLRARAPDSEKQPIGDIKKSKLSAKITEPTVENSDSPIKKSELPIINPETAPEPIKIKDFAHPESTLRNIGIYDANLRRGRPNPIHRQADVEGKDKEELQRILIKIEQLKAKLQKEKEKYSRLPKHQQTGLNETPQWDIEKEIEKLEEEKRKLKKE
ncbi:hypothetical protein Ddc_17966 [Ditylenchus destructor]|nr:hypothetical protein Ddc_17966 [Ditylenchus destructor]